MKVSKQTNNSYSTEIDKWIRVHYCPGAHMGHIIQYVHNGSVHNKIFIEATKGLQQSNKHRWNPKCEQFSMTIFFHDIFPNDLVNSLMVAKFRHFRYGTCSSDRQRGSNPLKLCDYAPHKITDNIDNPHCNVQSTDHPRVYSHINKQGQMALK